MKNTVPLCVTCDKVGGLTRAAVWRGKELVNLFVQNDAVPDLTGARYAGKVTRLVPAQKLAFVDCGLDEKVSVPSNNLQAGAYIHVEIKSTPRQGKAFEGKKIGDAPAKNIERIAPAPTAWQKAIASTKGRDVSQILISDKKDHTLAMGWLIEYMPSLFETFQPVAKEPVHPALDEHMDALLSKEVPMSKGGKVIIEPTQALISIDIDGGNSSSALEVNLAAAKEIMKHLRLRNLSGLIVVDCLKMSGRTDTAKVLAAIQEAAIGDTCAIGSPNMTKLGLVEFTRERKGMSLADILGKGAYD